MTPYMCVMTHPTTDMTHPTTHWKQRCNTLQHTATRCNTLQTMYWSTNLLNALWSEAHHRVMRQRQSCPIWMGHVTHEWVMSSYEWVMSRMNESCHTYIHWSPSGVIRITESWLRMSHVPRKWVMSQIIESCLTWMSHFTHIYIDRLPGWFISPSRGLPHTNHSQTDLPSAQTVPSASMGLPVSVSVCCSVLQCVAVCCSVLRCVVVCWKCAAVFYCRQTTHKRIFPVLEQYQVPIFAVCCGVLQCVAVCCSILQVCCSVLQCVAVNYRTQISLNRNIVCPKCTECGCLRVGLQIHCSTLQHTTKHCNTLQHTATHCKTLHHTASVPSK